MKISAIFIALVAFIAPALVVAVENKNPHDQQNVENKKFALQKMKKTTSLALKMKSSSSPRSHRGLQSGSSGSSRSGTLVAMIGRYPGYRGRAPRGTVHVRFSRGNAALTFIYNLNRLPRNCRQCGVHIHEGRTCADADRVLGHHWNSNNAGRPREDPWFPEFGAFYNSDNGGRSRGDFRLVTGFDFLQNRNRAVVLHAQDGARIGCGVLRVQRARSS